MCDLCTFSICRTPSAVLSWEKEPPSLRTPSYFLGQMTLNPTIKRCRFVQKHILRNRYSERTTHSPFGPWIPLKPLFPLLPFILVDPFKLGKPIRPVSPFAPLEPTAPSSPFTPLNPCAPVGPCVPLIPLVPLGPRIPRGPVFPGAPFSPFYPGYPGAPFSPLGPSWPVWQSLSAVVHAFENFLSISWRTCCEDNTPGVGAIFRLSRGWCLETLSRVSWNSVDNKNRLLLVCKQVGEGNSIVFHLSFLTHSAC